MSSNDSCALCGTTLERVRYFPRQLITADDMRAEQEWVRQKRRLHTRMLHGFGVVCGLSVMAPSQDDPPRQVTICPGYAATPQGDEVAVCEPTALDLGSGATDPEPCGDPWPCPPRGAMPGKDDQVVFVAIRYAECLTRPVRVHPAGCGCDTAGCERSRIRESFELTVLWELPQSHVNARKEDLAWRAMVKAAGGEAGERDHLIPAPTCPSGSDDPWVVLASVRLPGDSNTPVGAADISYVPRRVLLSISALMNAI